VHVYVVSPQESSGDGILVYVCVCVYVYVYVVSPEESSGNGMYVCMYVCMYVYRV
jgi:hypothetical protein